MLLVFLLQTLFCVTAQNLFYTSRSNPIVTHKYTSDPTTLVYKERVYLYTGHDSGFQNGMPNPQEWLVFSSDDLQHWQEHPVPLKKDDFEWAANKENTWAWAAGVVEKNGKFYIYATVADPINAANKIGVAVSDNPIGPFKDAIGKPLIGEDVQTIDPSVFIDDDGQAYIFWGGYNQCFYAKLKENMVELDSPAMQVKGYLEGFSAGSRVHKRDDWYYLSYTSGSPSKISYAMSKSINGPWEYIGIVNEVPANSATNHHSIIDFKGKSYFFYHNGALPNGGSFNRSVCVDYLYYNPDGTMKKVWMTSEGIYN
ncbi:family 43 glycosylhydrolase [Dysgonomonas sp. Marseille-P4677]|nr:family 43 glycosylhydrolase [Dysgonomonas sp. Marseille-P4677]